MMIQKHDVGRATDEAQVPADRQAVAAWVDRCGADAIAGTWCRNRASGRIEMCWRVASARHASANATEPPIRRHRTSRTCEAVIRGRPRAPRRRTMRGACA